jgi:two-component system response regulator PilR (NtrC family)
VPVPASAAPSSAPQAVPAAGAPAAPPEVPADLQTYLDRQEREILVHALRESGFNRTAAAARLGLSLRQIRYRIARLGIVAPGDATPGPGAGE